MPSAKILRDLTLVAAKLDTQAMERLAQTSTNAKLQNLANTEELVKIFPELTSAVAKQVIREKTARETLMNV